MTRDKGTTWKDSLRLAGTIALAVSLVALVALVTARGIFFASRAYSRELLPVRRWIEDNIFATTRAVTRFFSQRVIAVAISVWTRVPAAPVDVPGRFLAAIDAIFGHVRLALA